jgi:tRNA U34 5-methylaminomethyl-2-thiouridine-forming methyltransferase MnmC
VAEAFELVRLGNGVQSIREFAVGETMHPGLGPAAEAEVLYVKQLRLVERLRAHEGEFVVWDVGLGAAANVLGVLRAARGSDATLRLVSFDHSAEMLRFAIEHAGSLGYLEEFLERLRELADKRCVTFTDDGLRVTWQFVLADFPSWLRGQDVARAPKPHAILFDPYSPARNPAMWTAPLFARLFAVLDPARSCALATYSRSTMTRVALLLAGFYTGVGHATGLKEETTLAANTPALVEELLGQPWLERVQRSGGAEPLMDEVYRQAALSPETWVRLMAHPQFLKT